MDDTGVGEMAPVLCKPLARQPRGNSSFPSPDSMLCKLIFPRVLFSGGVFLMFITDIGMCMSHDVVQYMTTYGMLHV